MALLVLCSYGQSAKKYFKAGNKFYETGKFEDAIEQYSNAIDKEPSNPVFYLARGNAYTSLNRASEAKADFEKTIVFSPKNVEAYVKLGAACNMMGNYDEALRHLNRATGLDKRNKNAYPEKVITLINLQKYDQALKASDTAIIIKDTPSNYYWRGMAYTYLSNDAFAKREFEKSISKDKKYFEPRLALADLMLRTGDSKGALAQCNEIIKNDDRNTSAYVQRSKVYTASFDFPNAINDISTAILIDPDNPEFYLIRGQYYQAFNQHPNAINDFTKSIDLKPDNPDVFFARAESYEKLLDQQSLRKAMDDYKKITELLEFDPKAYKLLQAAQDKLYALNREGEAPEIVVLNPVPANESVEIRGDSNSLLISGKILDKSKIKTFTINNEPVTPVEKNGEFEFFSTVNVSGRDKVTLLAVDDYDNQKNITYSLVRTEINPPKVSIIAPYTSDDGQIYLDNNSPTLFIQGKLTDESKIKSIFIDGVYGSYSANDLNPSFTASVDINNKNKIIVEAEDVYGNKTSTEFRLNREAAGIAETNPMGKTWVVFIENSDYSTFASLDGPVKDINLMTRALNNYQIHQIIYKKNMTKADMERFFGIELRDQIRSNQVKSLLVWYAGHGKFINEVGYWIPVDARRDDEFTYYSLNTLRGAMETYMNYLTHTLVVTDACESGPSFYSAMRSDLKDRSCDDWQATQSKSSQVFSSAGYELALDNSQFTQTFYNQLVNNPDACIPIETIVRKVSDAHSSANQQKPKFGQITGLRDEGGTFFFIAK